ncbi:MAG: toxin-antitoxin system YwqK family antitoxin [Cyclobacteriaceae bacterium]|nr:toxin-antitoxin system YwqK family antitoxin [Cyclobacteriaceae bacterium]
MRLIILLLILNITLQQSALAQLYNRTSYHDLEKRHIKEFYQVKDTVKNILHGRYISFYLNGHPESKGQFINNETSGVWEFFYETGNIRMRGILRQNSNYGLWEFFYESGQKSMEGTINGKLREGEWKSYYENGQLKEIGSYDKNKHIGLWKAYFEDGVLKGEIDYVDDFGRYIEYYHSGKVYGEGPRMNSKNSGHWRYYAEDGTLQMEGEFVAGKKQAEWIHYFSSGKQHSKGHYENDIPVGIWEYYYETGELHKKGEYVKGKKSGEWKTFDKDGTVISESAFGEGKGLYKEYYPGGQVKVVGNLNDEKREGKWEFFYDNGKKEADCEYVDGRGTYYGYYQDGALQTKGQMEDDKKVGTWEIFERDGKLSGYYKPFYDDKNTSKDIAAMADRKYERTNASHTKGLSYFDPRHNEFKGVIVGTNPIFSAVGRFPVAIEFYSQERLGHEFEFIGIRDPFYKKDDNISLGKNFMRGYSIGIKQKMYNPMKAGMWYFGHEIRFTNLGHFINIEWPLTPDKFSTVSSAEQRIGWGVLTGYRIMRKNNAKGFTLDVFGSFNLGYRSFVTDAQYEDLFQIIEQKPFYTSFHFGLNIGNVFSFRL